MAKDQVAFNILISRVENNDPELLVLDLENLKPVPSTIADPEERFAQCLTADELETVKLELSLDDLRALANALKKNTVLKRLILNNNPILDEGAAILAEGLEGNNSISSLRLHFTDISPVGLEKLAAVLAKKNIKNLTLSNNPLGVEGAKILAKAFGAHPSLLMLNIERCSLGDNGIKDIASMVTANHVLKYLDVSMNLLSAKGMLLMSQATQNHPSLETLRIWGNAQGSFFDEKKNKVEKLYIQPTVVKSGSKPFLSIRGMFWSSGTKTLPTKEPLLRQEKPSDEGLTKLVARQKLKIVC
jgi:Leucine-rich repeat (LRR) protein